MAALILMLFFAGLLNIVHTYKKYLYGKKDILSHCIKCVYFMRDYIVILFI